MKNKGINTFAAIRFRKTIYNYYKKEGRTLPWRKTKNPYRILVSEIMLQQTQVERVLGKYKEFLTVFPDFASLKRAPLRKVLQVWQGMGYNRRALALKEIAKRVIENYQGILPRSVELLATLPGIGKATASAICAFAFNQPTVFIETNIRRVFIHNFFHDKENIKDDAILPFVEQTLDKKNPREWYYALMDYGVMLKKECTNPNKRSAHYQKQKPFEGSNRQVRGWIIKTVLEKPITAAQITRLLKLEPGQVKKNLAQLTKERFIAKRGSAYLITPVK